MAKTREMRDDDRFITTVEPGEVSKHFAFEPGPEKKSGIEGADQATKQAFYNFMTHVLADYDNLPPEAKKLIDDEDWETLFRMFQKARQ